MLLAVCKHCQREDGQERPLVPLGILDLAPGVFTLYGRLVLGRSLRWRGKTSLSCKCLAIRAL
jgi:hypothetical protein